jgi:hypothetical protein
VTLKGVERMADSEVPYIPYDDDGDDNEHEFT